MIHTRSVVDLSNKAEVVSVSITECTFQFWKWGTDPYLLLRSLFEILQQSHLTILMVMLMRFTQYKAFSSILNSKAFSISFKLIKLSRITFSEKCHCFEQKFSLLRLEKMNQARLTKTNTSRSFAAAKLNWSDVISAQQLEGNSSMHCRAHHIDHTQRSDGVNTAITNSDLVMSVCRTTDSWMKIL